MMMPGGPGRMLNTETQKPKQVGATPVTMPGQEPEWR